MILLLLCSICLMSLIWLVTTVISNMLLSRELQRKLPKFQSIPAVPVLGSGYLFRKDPTPPGIFEAFNQLHQRYGNDMIMQNFLNAPNLLVTSAMVVKQVIHAKTIRKSIIYEFMKPWVNEGLITALGKKWALRRKIITPAFHFKILEEFLTTFNQQSEVFITKLQKHSGKGDFNIYEYVTLCTLDIISETAMGVKINAQHNSTSSYVKSVKEMSNIIFKRLFSMTREYSIFFRASKAAQRQKATLSVLHGFTDMVIRERKTQLQNDLQSQRLTQQKLDETDVYGKRKMTLLEILLNVSVDGHGLSNTDVREEVDTFMFAGHDTTTACISFCAYHIAQNPLVQDRIVSEMAQILGEDFKNAELTYSLLQELKYLDMTIKEVLRIHPSVPFIGRKSADDMVIDGAKIPAGIDIAIMIYAMHHNPEVFPDPEKFDPERFNEENSSKRHPYSYIPFSVGERNCIGQKYALLEVKATLVKLLGFYRLLPCDLDKKVRVMADVTLRPVNGTFVKIEAR
ncbi:cytochrome P450 4c3-like [Malaya genurostris]|uniref:cytochrome P450 4c3-like n=1 Tax=Malaya genurostris TaxID=325434 RepID=UPI0026F3C9AE|nr:cytochrome P450 4c3-like [Malaya genurostris]